MLDPDEAMTMVRLQKAAHYIATVERELAGQP